MAPINPVLNPIDYKISRLMLQQFEHKLWVNKILKNKQLLAEVLERSNTVYEW